MQVDNAVLGNRFFYFVVDYRTKTPRDICIYKCL